MPTGPLFDTGKCIGCGLCVADCPASVLELQGSTLSVKRLEACLECGHCAAICKEDAVALPAQDVQTGRFSTFSPAPGSFVDIAHLASLMQRRRSCRAFLDSTVPGKVLDDLVKLAITAPSGTNSQAWTFTVLPDRSAVEQLAAGVGDFFRRLNKLSRQPLARLVSRVVAKDALGRYYREHHASVEEALWQWDEHRVDKLFWGAPAAILIGSRPEASCPAEDALLAASHLVLAAEAMGLGTCHIGFAVAAMARSSAIGRRCGIPADETIHAVIALGYPKRRYARPAGRKTPVVRFATP